jgi:predicted PolB exonuclease-like 3'-5' exonuclease
MYKILTFDIESIPDIQHAKTLYNIQQVNDEDAWKIIRLKRLEKTGHDFLPHFLQKIVAISIVFQNSNQVKIWSIGHDGETEAEIIQRFFLGIEKYQPTLVSWNGGGFDLPVLHYRSMLHHIQAPTYWENGEQQPEFKWNNYTSRYHQRHTDLMDVLSSYQNRAFAPLDEFSQILGLPGKIGLHGSEVFQAYQKGNIADICRYCESDVLNTHLIYLRFLYIKASITQQQYINTLEHIEYYIHKNPLQEHWGEFLPYLQNLMNQLK